MFDMKTIVEIAVFLIGLLGHAAYLGGRIQKIEDVASAAKAGLETHMKDDREDFRRVYDKLDGKADKAAGLHVVA